MAVVVVLEACVLHPAALRAFLMRLAIAGLIRARWSETILDEWERSVLRVVEGVDPEALRRTRELMKRALPDAEVTAFESLVERIELPIPTTDTSLPPRYAGPRRRSRPST